MAARHYADASLNVDYFPIAGSLRASEIDGRSGCLVMPLTEHEMRVLADIERDFNDTQPSLASGLRDLGHRHFHRLWKCSVLFVVGVVLLLTGAATAVIAIGVIGFVVMLVAAIAAGPAVRAWVRAHEHARKVIRRSADPAGFPPAAVTGERGDSS